MKPQMSSDEQFKSHLKALGERVTTPRLGIFRLLKKNSPIAMGKLCLKAREDGVDTATVYRTIGLFMRLGLVQEVGVGSRRLLELSDSFGGHHHHFWCSNCGRIADFDDESLEQALSQAAARMGIEVESHQLEIVGKCERCVALERPPS
jgi:Fe2+ or Zn2+ uptake regulation protein